MIAFLPVRLPPDTFSLSRSPQPPLPNDQVISQVIATTLIIVILVVGYFNVVLFGDYVGRSRVCSCLANHAHIALVLLCPVPGSFLWAALFAEALHNSKQQMLQCLSSVHWLCKKPLTAEGGLLVYLKREKLGSRFYSNHCCCASFRPTKRVRTASPPGAFQHFQGLVWPGRRKGLAEGHRPRCQSHPQSQDFHVETKKNEDVEKRGLTNLESAVCCIQRTPW